MTADALYNFLKAMPAAERKAKDVLLETERAIGKPLREIDHADPDFLWLKYCIEIPSEN